MSYSMKVNGKEVEVEFSEPPVHEKIEIAKEDLRIHQAEGEPSVYESADIVTRIICAVTDLPENYVEQLPWGLHSEIGLECDRYLRDLSDEDNELLADDLIASLELPGLFGKTGMFNSSFGTSIMGKGDPTLTLKREDAEVFEEFSADVTVGEPVEENDRSLTDIGGINGEIADQLRSRGYMDEVDLRETPMSELRGVPGIGKALAARIKADVGGVKR
jgi:hypothetical protein